MPRIVRELDESVLLIEPFGAVINGRDFHRLYADLLGHGASPGQRIEQDILSETASLDRLVHCQTPQMHDRDWVSRLSSCEVWWYFLELHRPRRNGVVAQHSCVVRGRHCNEMLTQASSLVLTGVPLKILVKLAHAAMECGSVVPRVQLLDKPRSLFRGHGASYTARPRL